MEIVTLGELILDMFASEAGKDFFSACRMGPEQTFAQIPQRLHFSLSIMIVFNTPLPSGQI